jgi:hypothetical protein
MLMRNGEAGITCQSGINVVSFYVLKILHFHVHFEREGEGAFFFKFPSKSATEPFGEKSISIKDTIRRR